MFHSFYALSHPLFSSFSSAEGSCQSFCPLWTDAVIVAILWAVRMLNAVGLAGKKTEFSIVFLSPAFSVCTCRNVSLIAGSCSREARSCLKLIPPSGVSFRVWYLRRPRTDVGTGGGGGGGGERSRYKRKLKQSHQILLQSGDFSH